MSMNMPLSQICQLLGLPTPEQDAMVTGMKIDSRLLEKGDLFIALKGEHVDGHQFLAQAQQAGAVAALVTEPQAHSLTQLVVQDNVLAFGAIAALWRQQCKAKVVAVTGSNGKTTVKEMVAAILAQAGKVTATKGNLNNELGVPLTLARLSQDDDYAVIEMGANHHGEIANLVALAKPHVALINNVAPAHLEGFGSIEGVAIAKGEIYAGLDIDGIAIVNADMPYGEVWQQALAYKRVIYFGLDNQADVMAKDIQLDPASSHFMVELDNQFHYINLPLPGLHNVANALAAIAIATALGISIDAISQGLASMTGVPHRLQIRRAVNESQLIDDTYNANPASFKQALATLTAMTGKHWLVLGDFGELGDDCEQIHQQMGLDAKQAGVERLFVLGEMSKLSAQAFGDGAIHFAHQEELQQLLMAELDADVNCLLKGSRFMKLDKLADALAVTGEV
jgi:UDP-N-acetylmuramoyl-tripeptide--D-alanyl-D-alanine ligase